jgi:hypothetical protein
MGYFAMAKDRMAGVVSLERVRLSEDVAAAVLFLRSDQAAFITGTYLAADGEIFGPVRGENIAYSGGSRRVERLVALTQGPCRVGQGVTEGLGRGRCHTRHESGPADRAGARRHLPILPGCGGFPQRLRPT